MNLDFFAIWKGLLMSLDFKKCHCNFTSLKRMGQKSGISVTFKIWKYMIFPKMSHFNEVIPISL